MRIDEILHTEIFLVIKHVHMHHISQNTTPMFNLLLQRIFCHLQKQNDLCLLIVKCGSTLGYIRTQSTSKWDMDEGKVVG